MTNADLNRSKKQVTHTSPIIAFLAALQFLTIFPPVIRRPFTPAELGSAAGFYPLVGLLLGAALFAADYLLHFLVPAPVRAALILAFWVILSGALHLDGFLDTCDGLLGGLTPESRLKIMRDERVGAYALSGGVLLLLVKFTALGALKQPFGALILAPTLSRWGMSFALFAFPYARSQGLGREIKNHITWREIILASLIALPIAWFTTEWVGLLAFGAAALITWSGSIFVLHRLDGLTGDTYGALNELIETSVLLILLALDTL